MFVFKNFKILINRNNLLYIAQNIVNGPLIGNG